MNKFQILSEDGCIYCGKVKGEYHNENCVKIKRKARYRFTIEFDEDVPACWKMEEANFWWSGQGSHCVGNIIDLIKEIDESEEEGCLCYQVDIGNVKIECLSLGDEKFLKE